MPQLLNQTYQLGSRMKRNNNKIIFIVIGSLNTLFSYFITIILFNYLQNFVNIFIIAIISNIISITMSFTTNKYFVFKSNGNYLKEYMRSYFVYGFSMIFGIFGLWFLVSILNIHIWVSQALLMVFSVLIAYYGNQKFTFLEKMK
jgi:putative flippase GtrA